MINALDRDELRIPSFWWFQTAGWCCFCLLCVLVVFPYVRQPAELGYEHTRDLFADQALMVLAAFLASLILRPVCRSLVQRSLSWIALEVRAAAWSSVTGSAAALIAGRFIIVRPEPVELLEACAKVSVLLFLWCNLYFSIKRSQWHAAERGRPSDEYASRFIVRTGTRIQVVPAEDLPRIAGAGDYSELHARNGVHLLRENMNSLEQRLDPAKFSRIHRSKIVNLARILELRAIENREYVVKLSDGSEHRSSRTYSDRIERWLDLGNLGK